MAKVNRWGFIVAVLGAVLLAGAAAAAAVELTGGSGSATAAVAPNSVAVIDPGSNRVVDSIPVGEPSANDDTPEARNRRDD